MPQPTVTPDILQTPNIHLDLTPQVTLNLVLPVNGRSQRRDLRLRQVSNPRIGVDTSVAQDIAACTTPYAINICQANLNPLAPRQVYTSNTCHISISPSRYITLDVACALDYHK